MYPMRCRQPAVSLCRDRNGRLIRTSWDGRNPCPILVEPHTYGAAVLGAAVRINAGRSQFEYFAASEILTTAGSLVAGIALAWWYVRRPEPKVITALRSVHTGSVNDYAAFSVAGLVLVSATLLLSQAG